MDISNEFEFNVVVAVSDASRISLTLSVTNNSPNDYFISGNSILTSGFIMKTFDITGPSFIPCSRVMRHDNNVPEKILLKSQDTSSNTLQLSSFCHFEQALSGKYEISFFNGYPLYNLDKSESDDFVMLSGSTFFLIGKTQEEVDFMNSLDYGNGL